MNTRFFILNLLPLPQSPPCSSGIPVTGLISTFTGSYLRQGFWRHGEGGEPCRPYLHSMAPLAMRGPSINQAKPLKPNYAFEVELGPGRAVTTSSLLIRGRS